MDGKNETYGIIMDRILELHRKDVMHQTNSNYPALKFTEYVELCHLYEKRKKFPEFEHEINKEELKRIPVLHCKSAASL